MTPECARRRRRAWFVLALGALAVWLVMSMLDLPGAWLTGLVSAVGVMNTTEWDGWLRGWRDRAESDGRGG